MAEIKVIEKQALSGPFLLEEIKNIGTAKDRAEIQNKTASYVKKFTQITATNARKLTNDLKALELPTLTEDHIAKIIDILPSDLSELKSVFTGSKTTITPENMVKIQEIVTKYLK